MESNKIHIGTSGWDYGHWRNLFYPKELEKKYWFSYYAEKFNTVEINNTFYNLPDKDTVDQWKENAPANFIYAIKASRYITHMKKLKDPKGPVENFLSTIRRLDDHLGALLFQIPPGWKYNGERFKYFLEQLPSSRSYAFEFRQSSWWNDEVYNLLKKHNAAFCIYHMRGEETPREITSDTVYIRLHGTTDKYSGSYSPRQLNGWRRWIENRLDKVKSVFVFFNNDDRGFAALNAAKLKGMFS